MARKAPHHAGPHQSRARALTRWAYADPDTRCGRCGQTLYHWKRTDRWEAGHVIDGQIGGPYRVEHRSCNRRAAAERTNALRLVRRTGHTSATW